MKIQTVQLILVLSLLGAASAHADMSETNSKAGCSGRGAANGTATVTGAEGTSASQNYKFTTCGTTSGSSKDNYGAPDYEYGTGGSSSSSSGGRSSDQGSVHRPH